MRHLTALIMLTAGLAIAAPGQADFRAGARIGTGTAMGGTHIWIRIGDRLTPRPPHRPDGGDRPQRYIPRRPDGPHHRPHPWPRPWPRDPWFRGYRFHDYEDPLALPPLPPAAPAVAETSPAEPAPPPDPRGPAIRRARGAPAEPAFTVGEPLPSSLPHVTLDWRLFDLPEPPPGFIYARVGRDVLLITADSRVVEKVVPPG